MKSKSERSKSVRHHYETDESVRKRATNRVALEAGRAGSMERRAKSLADLEHVKIRQEAERSEGVRRKR